MRQTRVVPAQSVLTTLPTSLVARYRAVDREVVGSAIVETPSHLAALTEEIRRRGIAVPLRLGFNSDFGILDGNHRIAVAIRLGLDEVPVELVRESHQPVPSHARSMSPTDLALVESAFDSAAGD
jgi:hypothetical protein